MDKTFFVYIVYFSDSFHLDYLDACSILRVK